MCIDGEWKRWVWLFIWWSYYNRKVDGAMEFSVGTADCRSLATDIQNSKTKLYTASLLRHPKKDYTPKHLSSFVFKLTGFGDQVDFTGARFLQFAVAGAIISGWLSLQKKPEITSH